MERPVCYDVTRLLTRVINATPNGIDRVDFALASHFLAQDRALGATATGFGTRLLDRDAASEAVAGIGTHWGEDRRGPDDDPAYRRIVAFLNHRERTPQALPRRRVPRLPAGSIARWIGRHGLPLRRGPAAYLPRRSIFLNASQFPLWRDSSFAWLRERPDVSAAFFMHDLLPILMPEYFRAAEYERHLARLRTFARYGAAALVTTRTVAADLEAHLATLGRRDCPIFVAPTPIAPVFATQRVPEPDLAGHPYFVFCATLEPRKNHLMILAVWRVLVERMGRNAPKLILVGTRGWHYAPILDLIRRAPALRSHVLEVSGLSTPALKRVIDNAQAVLMPSFAEGYGLPVHEALTAGAPVIASDIPVFRDITAGDLTLLSPLDGEAWLAAITTRSGTPRASGGTPGPTEGWTGYFAGLEAFLEAL